MSDDAKITIDVLLAAKALVERDLRLNLITEEKLRFTIEARRDHATKLVESGMSQRQAAKVLGVDQKTISNDLRKNSSETEENVLTEDESKPKTKAEKRAAREVELAAKQQALPQKRYGVILADPEWRFEPYSRESGMDRAADNHYPTSATDEICQRDVPSISAEDCVLFLWATSPMLRDAFRVMEAWGFEYKSSAVWDKIHIGTGYWFRNRHEYLLVGTKGDVPAPAMGEQFASLMAIPRKEHSAKPEQFYDLIEQYFPTLPKIELNARAARPGWDAWGYEAPEQTAA